MCAIFIPILWCRKHRHQAVNLIQGYIVCESQCLDSNFGSLVSVFKLVTTTHYFCNQFMFLSAETSLLHIPFFW